MWKNGKEGDTEGDESWKEKMRYGRLLKRKKKTEPRKKGGCGRRGKGSCRNVVGKTEWEETK